MSSKKFILASILFLAGSVLALQETPAQQDSLAVQQTNRSTVSVIRVEGTIGPTVTQYITRSIRESSENRDEALIIELDTPGGLLTSTQEIVQELLGTDHPTVVYVSPRGANAGSAGTFITLAAHIAAMAPATNIGAASPVSMGGGEMDTVAQNKIFNYSESFIQSIAEERDRNAEWARSAVRDGASITSDEALEMNVIDIMAEDIDDLVSQLHGMEVDGKVLNTETATIRSIDENLAEQFFSFILRPEVMLILTMVAIYGIIGEVTNPGAIVPGVSGVIALILLLYGVAAMPINLAGFLLIGLAIILFVAEAFTPTFGILLSGGAVAFFLGALMLFQDLPDEMQISIYWLVPATLLTVAFFAWIVTYGVKSLFNPPRSGLESTIGKTVEVVDAIRPGQEGRVFFDGEYWTARSDKEIKEGNFCEIIEFEGLKVYVKPSHTSIEEKSDKAEKV
ncbi:NfeD family protein [Rhodohalobacter sp. 614A]|uniref:NfeD family protein n=1 Tax=Rhodohalobacter sp. 614A TaxID=2908649 RepID=UPI001F3C1FE1|nr:nodulation protein NfeD [Rhodohalobacter sp. 614A]